MDTIWRIGSTSAAVQPAPTTSIALLLSLSSILMGGCQSGYLDWERQKLPGEPERPAYLQAYVNAHYRYLGTLFCARFSLVRVHVDLLGARVLFLGDHHRDELLHD